MNKFTRDVYKKQQTGNDNTIRTVFMSKLPFRRLNEKQQIFCITSCDTKFL